MLNYLVCNFNPLNILSGGHAYARNPIPLIKHPPETIS